MDLQQIFNDTDFVHTSGTKEELQVAGYLKMQCENMGVPANHMDLAGKEALEKMLTSYEGTVLFVSHEIGRAHV